MAEKAVAHILRKCTRCLEDKPATAEFFHPHKMGKYGLHSLCRPCKKEDDAHRRNRPDQKARQQSWRDANREKVNAYNKQYRDEGYSSTEHVASWRAKNLEHARATCRERQRHRRATDIKYRLKGRMSARLHDMLKGKAGKRSEDLLGYTMDELKQHIERQFTKGMSWDKVRRGVIEIDHIIPVREFNITSYDDPDFAMCWALSNLRPMWAKDNRSKNGKRTHLI